MDIAKPKKKWGLGIVSSILSVVLVVGLMPGFTSTALAADDDEPSGGVFSAPTEAKGVGTYITASGHAANESTLMYLGLDGTTFRPSSFNEDMDLAEAERTPRLGIFGSDWNQNADTYLWNFFYNTYAEENGLTKTEDVPQACQTGPGPADTSGVAVGTRADILLGISSTSLTNSYEAQIAALPENNDDDPNNDYDPYLVAYNDASTFAGGNVLNVYSLAKAAEKVEGETSRVSRYDDGDVMKTAKDYEQIALSTQYYILSQIDQNKTTRKSFVYISSVDTSTNTFSVSLSSTDTMGAADAGRMMEAIQNCADNGANKIEAELGQVEGDRGGMSYTMTPAQLEELNPDVIICGGEVNAAGGTDHTSGPDNTEMRAQIESVLADAGASVDSTYYVNTCNAVNVYGSNGSENAMYVPSVLGFIYDDVVDQMDVMAWWYKNIYHVKDEYVQSAINIVCELMTTVDGLTVSEGYDTRVSQKFAEGEAYYESNKDAIVASYPNLMSYEDYMSELSTTMTSNNTTVDELTASKDDEGNYEPLAPVVTCDGKEITWNDDYLYKVYDADGNRVWMLSEPGTYTINIEGIVNYSGEVSLTLTVNEAEEPVVEVDKSALEAAITQAKDIDTSGYTDDSVATFEAALKNAQDVDANAEASQTEVDAATDALVSAIAGLEVAPEPEPEPSPTPEPTPTVDKEALEALIGTAEALDISNCTEMSRQALESALAAAEVVANNGEATQDEVDAASLALSEAIQGLQTQFTDVTNPDDYYYEPIYSMVKIGAITGYEDGSFGVGDSMTRAQLVTVMWRYCEPGEYATYDEPNSQNTSGLPDVPDGQYYTGAVNWAVANNVVTGNLHEDGTYTFNPDDPMTFDQLAAVVARYSLGGVEAAESQDTSALDNGPFTDPEAVEDFARGPMSWAIENEIVTGNNNGDGTYTLDPVSDVPRERATTVLWRAIDGDKF